MIRQQLNHSADGLSALIEQSKRNIIVQVLSPQLILSQTNPGILKYKVFISDGLEKHIAFFGNDAAMTFQNAGAPSNSIVVLHDFLMNKQPNRIIIVIVKITMIVSNNVGVIGSPVNYNNNNDPALILSHNKVLSWLSMNGSKNSLPEYIKLSPIIRKNINKYAFFNQNNSDYTAKKTSFYQFLPKKIISKEALKTLPYPQLSKPSTSNSSDLFLPVLEAEYIPLILLNPANSDFLIKVRVIRKSGLKNCPKGSDTIKCFSIDLIDKEGTIITEKFFGDAALEGFVTIKVNAVYFIANGIVRPGRFNNNPKASKYEVIFDPERSYVIETENEDNLPLEICAAKVKDLPDVPINSFVDVVGFMLFIEPCHKVEMKYSNDSKERRTILICDASNTKIEIILWDELAEEFRGQKNGLIAIKSARVVNHNGTKCLLSSQETRLLYESDKGNHLSSIFHQFREQINGQTILNAPPFSLEGNNDSTIEQIHQALVDCEKETFFNIKAFVTYIKRDYREISYKKLREHCTCKEYRKNPQIPTNGSRCVNCGQMKSDSNIKYFLIFFAELSDHTGSLWVVAREGVSELICQAELNTGVDLDRRQREIQKGLYDTGIYQEFRFCISVQPVDAPEKFRIRAVSAEKVRYAKESEILLEQLSKRKN